mmetsp:Transcript_126259/g.299792  ORF Transcript_126259/g.299792 Transcript_126259/m.299792 type:complete len:299 (-) Transcript_126259:1071-1967(-)
MDRIGIRRILDQGHTHIHRRVVEGRDLVGAGAAGEAHPRLQPRELAAAPHRLLNGGPTEALGESALDLAYVNGRIQAVPNVHENVCSEYPHIARQHVNLHLRAGCAEGEVVERLPSILLWQGPVIANARRGVEAVRRQIAAVHVRGAHRAFEICALLQIRLETALDLLAGAKDGHAVDIGGCGGGSGGGVGHGVSPRLAEVDILHGDAKCSRGDLADLGVEPLTHLCSAVCHQHSAVGVDMHQRPTLVHERRSEADAELGRHLGNAPLPPAIAAIELLDLLLPLMEAAALNELVPHPL